MEWMSGSDRTIRGYAAWLRRWAWAIALVGTIIGFGIILPVVHSQLSIPRLLVVLPLSWLFIFLTVRWSANFLPKTLFPGEE